uniref:4Fe-4S ferredoxin-type domain-containing protein n=1 Tax=Caulobacter sp. (strain K31) TaxID=366602 RepID=B0T4I7_CAUSK
MTRDPIFDLLPAVFRQADIGQGDPLRALTDILQTIDHDLHVGVDELYDAWFIQTCPLDWVAMIGGLVGVSLPTPVRPEHRALVADTLAARRRKGLAAALPILLRGASGWYVLPLTTGEPVDQAAPNPLVVPSATWPLLTSDADGAQPSKSASISPLDGSPAAGLWVWRLPVFGLEGVTPAPVAPPAGWPSSWAGWFRRYWLNPLGLSTPLWNRASTTLPLGPAPITALPVRTSLDLLTRDLARHRRDWPIAAPGGPTDSRLYGPQRGLLLSQQDAAGTWSDVPPLGVRAMKLGPFDLPPPDYPVFLSGAPDLTTLKAVTFPLQATLGDTIATLEVSLGDAPSLQDAASALQSALAKATVTQPGTAPQALTGATVLTWGTRLAVVPGDGATGPLAFAPPKGAKVVDPLMLINGATAVRAMRTAPLGADLLARFYSAAPASLLQFTDADGRAYAARLPLVADGAPTVVTTAAALQAALPGTTVMAIGERILILPPPPGGKPSNSPLPAAAPMAALAWDLGLTRGVVLDPDVGACAWPAAGAAPQAVSADYGYAAPMGLGGGLYPRTPQSHPDTAIPYPVAPTGPASFPGVMPNWIRTKPKWAVFTPVGSGTFPMVADLVLAAGQTLMIQAGAQQRPMIATDGGALAVTGPATGATAPGVLRLDGLLWRGGLAVSGGVLALTLTDVTLYATGKTPALGLATTPSGSPPQVAFSAERCMLAPIDGTGLSGTLNLADSIIGPLSAPYLGADALTGCAPGLAVTLARTTVLGATSAAGGLAATDTLFVGPLFAAGQVTLDHCYVADLQWTPVVGKTPVTPATDTPAVPARVEYCTACGGVRAVRLWRCHVVSLTLDPAAMKVCACAKPGPSETRACAGCAVSGCADACPLKATGAAWEGLADPPNFYPDSPYPDADFARLTDANPPQILTGATDQGEIGAFNAAQAQARSREFDAALRGALLFGAGVDVTFLN